MVSNTQAYEMHKASLVKACRMSIHLWDELVQAPKLTTLFFYELLIHDNINYSCSRHNIIV